MATLLAAQDAESPLSPAWIAVIVIAALFLVFAITILILCPRLRAWRSSRFKRYTDDNPDRCHSPTTSSAPSMEIAMEAITAPEPEPGATCARRKDATLISSNDSSTYTAEVVAEHV